MRSRESVTRLKGWPKTGSHLSNALRRAASFLRKAGVVVNLNERAAGTGGRSVSFSTTANKTGAACDGDAACDGNLSTPLHIG